MAIEWNPKQSPVQGLTGLWGGASGALMNSSGASTWYGDRCLAGMAQNINYWDFSTTANAQQFGNSEQMQSAYSASSNGTRAVFGAGGSPDQELMQYVTVASTGNAANFGHSNYSGVNTRAGWSGNGYGGNAGGGYPIINTVDYYSVASAGNAQDFGDLSQNVRSPAGGMGDGESFIICGGGDPGTQFLNRFSTATGNDGTNIGNIQYGHYWAQGLSGGGDHERCVIGGGFGGEQSMQYFSTQGSSITAQNFGSLGYAGWGMGGSSNDTRGVWTGGYSNQSKMSYITVANTGNAQDFGELAHSSYGIGSVSGD